MRNRIAVWGRDAQEKRVLITIELQVSDNIVRIQTYPEKVVSDDVFKSFMDKWRKNEEADLPEPDRVIARELSVTEGLLPDDLKAEQTDMILRAQTEWHYHVLSDKLAQTYKNELAEIEDRIERASEYSSDLWNQAKNFWQKVQGQLQDKTLLRQQGNDIRKRVDKSFEKLKAMREVLNEKYKEQSEKNVATFGSLLEDAEKRIGEGTHLNKVFNDLRDIQKKFHNVKFTKTDRDAVYSRIDAAFKAVKEKRGQGGGAKENRNAGRTQARLDGLQKAMDRMKSGIGRDENDLKFERRRIEKTNGQLEKQIREAKVVMIESRIASKQLKLDDMEKTKAMLVKKIEQEKIKDEKRAKKAAERAAADAAKAKIAADMATRVVSPEEKAKLQAAADKIKAGKKKGGRTKPEDRIPRKVKNFIAFSEVISGDSKPPAPITSEPEVTEVAAAAATAGAGAPLVNEQAASVAEAISGDSDNLTAAEVATGLADANSAAKEATATDQGPEEMTIAETAGSAIASVITTVGGAANSATEEGGILDQIGDVLSSAGESISDTLEDITDTAKAVAQVASEKISDAKDGVEETVEGEASEGGFLDQVGDVLASAGASISNTFDDLTEGAKEMAESAAEKIDEAADKVEGAVEDAVDEAKEKISGEEE
jgi:hypothetical protein